MMKRRESCTGMRLRFCRLPEQGASHFAELADFIPENVFRHIKMRGQA